MDGDAVPTRPGAEWAGWFVARPAPAPLEGFYKVVTCDCCGTPHEVPLEDYLAALADQTRRSLAFCRHRVIRGKPDDLSALARRLVRRTPERCEICAVERLSIDPRLESWTEVRRPVTEWVLERCVGRLSYGW